MLTARHGGGGYCSRPKCSGISSSYRQLMWPAPALPGPNDPKDNNSNDLISFMAVMMGHGSLWAGMEPQPFRSVWM